jgi:hypothetical protein
VEKNKVDFGPAGSNDVTISFNGVINSPELWTYMKAITSNPERVAKFEQMIKVGAHALNLNSASMLLTELEKSIEGQLSPLRVLYEKKRGDEKSSQGKGAQAERDIEALLREFAKELKFEDSIRRTGDSSEDGLIRGISDRKFGDIEVKIAGTDLVIGVESKFDKSKTLGTPTDKLSIDNARGQVKAAQANRGAAYVIFVTEAGSQAHTAMGVDLLVDFADMGIYVAVDKSIGDFEELRAGYILARTLTLALSWPEVQQQHIRSVAALLVRSITKIKNYAKVLGELKKLGDDVSKKAATLVGDFQDDLGQIDAALDYLKAVTDSSPSQALDLKLQDLNRLTGEKFTKK